MSGIYIPNADMPEKGQVVYIFPDGTWQKAFLGMREPFQGGLVHPIPDHGRLGDLDEFYADINESALLTDGFKETFNLWFDEQETIIPADLSLPKLPVNHGSVGATTREEALRQLGLDPERKAMLKSLPKWISVKERLPENPHGCLLLVWDSPYDGGDDFLNYLPYFAGWDGERWNDGDGQQVPFEVEYWMPLPELPKEEQT